MDSADTKFGRGPRELGGSVDLIKQCKLWPHHEFFCKRLLPVEISETRYLHNVVGEAKIEKGEGMELDQLFQNASSVENRHPDLQPFDMGILREAFKMREATYADLSYMSWQCLAPPWGASIGDALSHHHAADFKLEAEKGTRRKMFELNGDFIDNKKYVKHDIRDKDKSIVHTGAHHQKDSGTRKDDGKISEGHHYIDPENLQKHKGKRKFEGGDNFSSVQRHQKTKLKNLKVKNIGMLRKRN